jgi:hypothetical protein
MQTDLRARLLANGTIAGLVSTRVDWGIRPQGKRASGDYANAGQ